MAHIENHKKLRFFTDTVIGMSDGLTVPFALAAGLKQDSKVTWYNGQAMLPL